ncbi:MAG: PIG-L family deacetylase [Candidatus Jorgensenbacteria bacterium]
MRGGTLFVQPHSDDIVMSSYFLIKAEVLPRPYYLLTIFSKSNWIDPIKKEKRHLNYTETTITQLRKGEDRRFAKLLRLSPYFFDFGDCLLRNKKTYFCPHDKLEKNLVDEISRSIIVFIKAHHVQSVVVHFPSGSRQHLDHRIVYRASKDIKPPTQLYFVDDFPYSRVSNLGSWNLRIFKRVKIKDIQEKFRAMELYDSQTCKSFFNGIQKITTQNKGFERILILKNRIK